MKSKTKLIATLMAMCLVITLGVFGILAVKTLNMSVGGNITFTADGISFEVSKGEFKTTSGAEYTGITSQTGKMQGFEMNTNTKLSDVQDKINSWAGLDLVATESLGDPVLHFSITNKMEDEILSFNPTITLGTNINDNMEILISPRVANIQANQTENFTITFHVKDISINAGLTGENYSGFAINILLSTAVVAEPSEMPQMTFAPTETDSNKYVVSNCSTATGDVVIPSFVKVGTTNYPVTEIADGAFQNNTDITSITIPNTVTRIGKSAFSGSSLSGELIIPNSVTVIDEYSFNACNISGELIIPDSVITIGRNAFEANEITHLTIGNGVTTIGMYAFKHCSQLTSLVLGNSVTTIGSWAFYECPNLSGELIIPDSVTTIGGFVFDECTRLTSLKLGNSLQSIEASSFSGCTGLSGELIIPNSMTKIGDDVFGGCENITSVVFGNNLKTIGSGAFCGTNISSVIIPDSVTIIDMYAFETCGQLTSVVIGNGVTRIGVRAFADCNNLTSFVINATTPPTLGGAAFMNENNNNFPIYVPSTSVEAYKSATNWSEYASRIFAIA